LGNKSLRCVVRMRKRKSSYLDDRLELIKIITYEAGKLETQIIKRMMEWIVLKVDLNIVTFSEWWRENYIPLLN